MNIDQHSDILNAYLSRLPVADLRKILAVAEGSQKELVKDGAARLRREFDMRSAVRESIAGLTEHDRDVVERFAVKVLGE